jgi:hypothetical protein
VLHKWWLPSVRTLLTVKNIEELALKKLIFSKKSSKSACLGSFVEDGTGPISFKQKSEQH